MIFFINKANYITQRKSISNIDFFEPKSLTILICAKNEAVNLSKNLPFIVNQNYPKELLKILVINDGSTDNSDEVLKELKEKYAQLSIHNISNDAVKDLPGKKFALKEGVKLVDTEFVLLTDADCKPASNNWAMEMMKATQKNNNDIVLGYGSYEKSPGWLQDFIQFETLHTAMQYSSYALADKAYMGVGRNLLYRSSQIKNAFQDERLLYKLAHTSSGDDDLMINHLKDYHKIGIAPHPHSYTESIPAQDWSSYYRQKSRHTSSSKYYDTMVKLGLGVYALAHFLAYFLPVLIIILMIILQKDVYEDLFSIIAFSLLLVIFKYINFLKWSAIYVTPIGFLQYLKSDIFWAMYNVIFSPFIFWKNQQKWN